MRTVISTTRCHSFGLSGNTDLAAALAARIVGQPNAVDAIVPHVQMFKAGLAPEGRPAGIFLLLGPSGTGKTKTVEALAGVLHGNEKNLLRIDCGEFQMDHEVAKLVGAPPGYLGHRETQPMLSQAKLNAVATDACGLSIVLLDEIEKAAPSMTRLLLGILDKGILRLGDNSSVSFERSMIFMTSNLGARDMLREIKPGFGFESFTVPGRPNLAGKLSTIGAGAVNRRFSPEFVNRIDSVVTYQPLSGSSLQLILEQQLADLQLHIINRLGPKGFQFHLDSDARRLLLEWGFSASFGARELKRVIHRQLTQPLVTLLTAGHIDPGTSVRVTPDSTGQSLLFDCEQKQRDPASSSENQGSAEPRSRSRNPTSFRRPPRAA